MTSTTLSALVSLSGRIELSILVKATILLALGLAAARLAGRARASVRHLLLAATFGAVLSLPVVNLAAPNLTIRVPLTDRTAPSMPSDSARGVGTSIPATVAGSARTGTPAEPAMPPWRTIAGGIWLAGMLAICSSLALAVWRLQRIRRTSLPRIELHRLVRSLAERAGVRRSVDILEHEAVVVPLTCGVLHPAILLPTGAREWADADLANAIAHELEHVRRFDWIVQIGARVVCACYWFQPLAWIALRRMSLDAERACDDAVVRVAERTDYADQLVVLARQLSAPNAPAMLGMANRSELSVRVSALLDDRLPRGRAGLMVAATTILSAALVVSAIAPLRAVASPVRADFVEMDDRSSEESSEQQPGRRIDRALYEAAKDGDTEQVDDLLSAGANLNAVLDGDGSPLIGAVRSGRVELVRHLLDRGADVNMPVSGDGNPLIVAASEGAASIVELLLDRGANIDQIVPGDETALIQASGEGHLEVVKLLVSRGANVNLGMWVDFVAMESVDTQRDSRTFSAARQREWRSPLSMARKHKHPAVLQFLLSAGAQE